MTPEATLYEFFNSFGIPAYPSSSVPDRATFPRITYDLVMDGWLGGEQNIPVNVWYRTESEAEPNAKVREMRDAIGPNGKYVTCDGGALWIKRGMPWAQAMVVEGEDEQVKRRYVNVNVEYIIP